MAEATALFVIGGSLITIGTTLLVISQWMNTRGGR